MELKELSREIVFAEIIAERGRIIINQHNQIGAMQKELEQARKTIAEKDALLVEGQNEIIKLQKTNSPQSPL